MDWPGRHREREIWFTATRSGPACAALAAPSRSRESSERCIARRTGSCCTTSPRTAECCCLETRFESPWRASRQGMRGERDLTWLLASCVTGLSAGRRDRDFRGSVGAGAPPEPTLFRRHHGWFSGGPDWRGGRRALSPDGKWVLASSGENLVLLPTGAGAMVTLPKGNVVRVGDGSWLGDSKRIVFTGDAGDNKPRGYIQEIPAGIPRAITPEGVRLAGKAAVRDDTLHPRSRRRDLDALSDSRRRWSARSGAHAWRYPASMEPRWPLRVYGRQRRGSQAGSR